LPFYLSVRYSRSSIEEYPSGMSMKKTKKKLQKILSLVVLLVSFLTLSNNKYAITGKWIHCQGKGIHKNYPHYKKRKFLFFKNNTAMRIYLEGTWEINNNRLAITDKNGRVELFKIHKKTSSILIFSEYFKESKKFHFELLHRNRSSDSYWVLKALKKNHKNLPLRVQTMLVLKNNKKAYYGKYFRWKRKDSEIILKSRNSLSLKIYIKSQNEIHLVYEKGMTMVLKKSTL
jgi:hypothetical protein